MKKIFITGATGFIGKAFLKYVLNNNVEVWAAVRNIEKIKELDKEYDRLHIISLGFSGYESILKICNERDFDCFFHFAWDGCGYSANDYILQARNITLSADAVMLAANLKCKKFFFPESSHEYLVDNDNNFSNIYGIVKSASKNICKILAKRNNIIYNGGIFANVFGIGDYSNRSTNTILTKLLLNEDIDLIEGNNLHEWTYIDDAVSAIEHIVCEGKDYKSYFVGRKNLYTFKDIISISKLVLGSKSHLRFGTYHETDRIDYSMIDTDLIYKDTNFQTTSKLEDNIIKTAEWLQKMKSSN